MHIRSYTKISVFLFGSFLGACSATSIPENEASNQSVTAPEENISVYGIDESGYTIETHTIKPNQFFSEILLPLGISYPQIAELERVAKEVYPLNKVRARDTYHTFCSADSAKSLAYLVLETSKADFVIYQFQDSIAVSLGRKPIESRIREASGTIQSSLNATIAGQDLPPMLSYRLSAMYAWAIDFYRIQKGDHFKVIFEEEFIDGHSIGMGKIIAAEFVHKSKSFYGFWFETEQESDFYDENARSMRKAFLQAPVEYSRISSGFTMKRFHPVQKRWKAHLGTDYAAPKGTPIMATGDGAVIEAGHGKYNGNYVKIRHNGSYTTQYLHMHKILAKKGQVVKQGEIIGTVGSTGLATGPHVCYRFWKDGKQVDPYRQEFPPSNPVPEAYLTRFHVHRDSLQFMLNGITIERVSAPEPEI